MKKHYILIPNPAGFFSTSYRKHYINKEEYLDKRIKSSHRPTDKDCWIITYWSGRTEEVRDFMFLETGYPEIFEEDQNEKNK